MSGSNQPRISASLAGVPVDELQRYARRLGLYPPEEMPRGELLRLIQQRLDLIASLDREALLDVVVWARRPVRSSADNEELAREIVQVQRSKFEDLSQRGLEAVARLRGLELHPGEPRAALEQRVRGAGGWAARLRRFRRRIVGGWIARALHDEADGEYHFLPEDQGPPTAAADSVKRRIEQEGIVPGLARTLKGVADDYIAQKLDEIERRIDAKLDEIDARLAEWRDREVRNRLRILKITLIVSIVIALLCLAYDVLDTRIRPAPPPAAVEPEHRDGHGGRQPPSEDPAPERDPALGVGP
ncbi:MAG TPA: hypothetical protein PKK06_09625 [Phycisphaerae bacterium]|nr:hypothetical protein [Phycisphaerae bacterium]HNU45559.1 hypothetical protein [Phycisphaerae bacterium]